MARKNIYETEAVREFVAGMSPLSRRKYLVARQVLQDVGYLRAPEGEKVAGEENLFPITIHAPNNERVFYCYDDGNHGFHAARLRQENGEDSVEGKGDGHQNSQTTYWSMTMITKEELAKGIARTQSDMDVAMRDPALRNEVSAVEARYAALELFENYFKSAAGSRKLSAYRSNYHRDFILTVSLDDQDAEPVKFSSREMALA